MLLFIAALNRKQAYAILAALFSRFGFIVLSLRSNKLVRQVSLLLSGTLLVQLLNFAFMPFILRLYGPDAFGVLGTFNALLLVLFPLAACCLPMAVVLAKNARQAADIAQLSWLIALLFAVVLWIILLLFKMPLIQLFSLESLGNMIFLLPLALLLAAKLQVTQQLCIRNEQFSVLAKADVIQAVLLNMAKLLLGLWQAVAIVLISLTVFASSLHTLLLSRLVSAENRIPLPVRKRFSYWRYKRLLVTLRKYKAFPLFQAPQALLNAASQSAPVLLLAAFYGAAAAGFYTLAKAVLVLPSALLGRAVGDVFYPHFTKAKQQQKPLLPVLVKATLSLAAIGLIPFGVLAWTGPWLFDLVFGEQWASSGEYARWMSLWMFAVFVNTPSVKAVMVLGVQHWAIALNLFTLGLRVFALWWFTVLYHDPLIAVAAYAAVGIIHSCTFIMMACCFSHRYQYEKRDA